MESAEEIEVEDEDVEQNYSPPPDPVEETKTKTKTKKKKSPGFIQRICCCCTSKTKIIDEAEQREWVLKKTLFELLIYLIFLVFVCIVGLGRSPKDMYHFTNVMMELFLENEDDSGVSFKTIETIEDFWSFAKGPLMDGLYWEIWYNDEGLPSDVKGLIYYENKLLGVPRMRQIRVHTNTCEVDSTIEELISDCYGPYRMDIEDKEPFGLFADGSNETAWIWQSEQETGGFFYWGQLATYMGSGYVQDLFTDRVRSLEALENLENNLWIQRGSRAVLLSFTVYNANVNLFCVITLLVEIPATGGALTSWSFNTVSLIRYATKFDEFLYICEIVVVVFIVFYTLEETFEIVSTGFIYFINLWNLLDLTLNTVAVLCIMYNYVRMHSVDRKLTEIVDNQDKFLNLQYLGFWEMRFNNAVAMLVFLAWVKVFKYISFNKTLTQLSTTLSRCAGDLLGFFVMFMIVFLAFTQLGYLLFSSQVKDFSTFLESFFTLFRIILGDFDFQQLEEANRVLGPIFFMLFVFFVFFVLINMFLAIINDTYSEVKSDMANETDMFIMSDFLKQRYGKFWDKLKSKEKIEGLETLLQSTSDEDIDITFEDWKDVLQAQGYTEDEITTVFAKYDDDGDRALDGAERRAMLEELQQQKETLAEESKYDDDDDEENGESSEFIRHEELKQLMKRLDRMESILFNIVTNIDSSLSRLTGIR